VAKGPGDVRHDAWLAARAPEPTVVPGAAIREDSRLIVYSAGCRFVDVPMPPGDAEIRLERGIPVRFELDGALEIPSWPFRVVLEFEALRRPSGLAEDFAYGLNHAVAPIAYHEDEADANREGNIWIDRRTRSATALFPFPGRWRVQVTIEHVDEMDVRGLRARSTKETGLRDEAEPVIEVEDRDDVQTIALSPEAEEYARVLARVKARE
jgi:hypothetical protein